MLDMDYNNILLWLAFAYSLFSLIQLLRFKGKGNMIWIIKNSAVLGISLTLLKVWPEMAGYLGGLFWSIFIFLPLLGFRLINKLRMRQLYSLARFSCLFLWLFHPDQGLILNSILLKARLLAKQGKREEAVSYLKSFQSKSEIFYLLCTVNVFQIEQRWEELVKWLKGIPVSSTLFSYYCLALGETGLIQELVQVPVVFYSMFEKLNYLVKNTIRLYIFAFSGDKTEVEYLLNGSLSDYSKEQKKYWTAIALQAGGEKAEAEELLAGLGKSKDEVLKKAAARRLALPADLCRPNLSPEAAGLVTGSKEEFHKEEEYSFLKKIKRKKAFVTLALVAINIIVFVFEILLGGSTNETTLYKMGALYTMGFTISDCWRIISAQFLHYGVLHLVMNMAGLYILGPYIESFVGHVRYALIYFISGIGALGCFLLIATLNQTYDFLVGASAGIMGIVGALLAILLKGVLAYRTKQVKNQLFILSFFIGLQILFDLSTPEVSFWGHFCGLIIGFSCAWLLLALKKKQE
jgi:rhomboid protease GluP